MNHSCLLFRLFLIIKLEVSLMIKINTLILVSSLISTTAFADFETAEEHASYIIGLMENAPVVGEIITVGDEFGCDYKTISEALSNSEPNDEIRIQSDTYIENLNMTHPVNLTGGFASCADAEEGLNDGNKAVVNPVSPDEAGLSLSWDYEDATFVNIKNLEFVNSKKIGVEILNQGDDSLVHFTHTGILNSAGYGLNVSSGNVLIDNSEFIGNSVGVRCSALGTKLLLHTNVLIEGNVNNEFGGGIGAECFTTLFSGVTLNENQAERGGGIFVGLQKQLNIYGSQYCKNNICFGEIDGSVVLSKNKSTSGGGGLYLWNKAVAKVVNAYFVDNFSIDGGGAVFLDSNAEFYGSTINQESCSETYCSAYKGNKADHGGAFFLSNGSTVAISNAYFAGQRAGEGLIVYMQNVSNFITGFTVEGSLFTNNGSNGEGFYADSSMFGLSGNDSFYTGLRILKSTIADNHYVDHVVQNFGVTFEMLSTIVRDSGSIYFELFDTDAESKFDCVIAHELNSLVGATRSEESSEPGFVDPDNGDYHLVQDALAQDYCDDAIQSTAKDIDGESWNFDDESVDNEHGAHDVGFDELCVISVPDDLIFSSSFEDQLSCE